MTFWGLTPDMADIGLELRLIPHNGEWNIAQDLWQWDYCGRGHDFRSDAEARTVHRHDDDFPLRHDAPVRARRNNIISWIHGCLLQQGVTGPLER